MATDVLEVWKAIMLLICVSNGWSNIPPPDTFTFFRTNREIPGVGHSTMWRSRGCAFYDVKSRGQVTTDCEARPLPGGGMVDHRFEPHITEGAEGTFGHLWPRPFSSCFVRVLYNPPLLSTITITILAFPLGIHWFLSRYYGISRFGGDGILDIFHGISVFVSFQGNA